MSEASQVETKQRPWWLILVAGIVATFVGAILLWSPAKTKVETYLILVAVLGIYFLIQGILDLVSIFVDHSMWGWKLFIGAISIFAGLAILAYPVVAAVTLPSVFALVLGLWGLLNGIILLIMAFRGGGWGAGILGVLGIILGIALIANYSIPGMGLATLWVIALTAFFGGIVLIFQAFRQRSD